MALLNLPNDILVLIPNHLHNIEDLMNASSTCRTLRNAFSQTSPRQILRLAAAQSRIFFRPDPHFLVAATVSQVATWGLQSPSNTETLRTAIMGGIEGLYDLCISKSGLTMEKIRTMYEMRFTTLKPTADFIDKLAGRQWYSTPNFWSGGVSDAFTIDCEVERAMYQIIIYGELFNSTMEANLRPELGLPGYDIGFRLDYIRYCIPDWVCKDGNPGMGRPRQVGPYDPEKLEAGEDPLPGDQIALNHLLNCRRWREAWERVRRSVGDDFEEEWRQAMWHAAVQCNGFFGLEMLRDEGLEGWKGRLREMRGAIERLEVKPKGYEFGPRKYPGTEYPCMALEVYVLMVGLWDGSNGAGDAGHGDSDDGDGDGDDGHIQTLENMYGGVVP